jgi:hypothetical protein
MSVSPDSFVAVKEHVAAAETNGLSSAHNELRYGGRLSWRCGQHDFRRSG